MPAITKISRQKKAGYYNLEIDYQFAFGVSEAFLVQEKLFSGKRLSREEATALKRRALADRLYNASLRLLASRPRSEREIHRYLRQKLHRVTEKTLPEEKKAIAEIVLAKLRERRYINDGDFCAWLVKQRASGRKPRSKRAVCQELREKGVGEKLAERALQDYDDASLAKAVARRQARKYAHLSPKDFRQRLLAYLSRRGFPWEEAKNAVDEQERDLYNS